MKTNKKISQDREKAIGKQIGGRPHIASGALWFQKGDVSNEFIIIEDKFTAKDSYSLSLDTINKIDKESKQENKIPVMSIGFQKHKFSVAFVNTKYCREDFIAPFYESTKHKSYNIDYAIIKERYISCFDKYSPIIKVHFTSVDKSYYLFEWDSFIENISSTIYY
jgi:hypothetical protein